MVSELRGVPVARLLSESSQGQWYRGSQAGLEAGDQGPESCPRWQLCGRQQSRPPLTGTSVGVYPALPSPLPADSLPGRPRCR